MTDQPIRTQIAAARASIQGDYVSTSRVVDTLLDLRSAAAELPELVATIDHTLASIPGRSVVANDWWVESLDTIAGVAAETARPVDVVAG